MLRSTATLLQAPGWGQRLEPGFRAFVADAALLTPIRRCRTLQELLTALGYECELLRGAQPATRIGVQSRVQPLASLRMAEEVYGQRLSLRWRDPAGNPTLLLLLQGRCIVEAGGGLLHLQAGERNGGALVASSHDFTITQAPCRLVRLLLPPGTVLQPSDGAPMDQLRGWRVDLGLLLPMQRLLEQSLRHAAAARTREELASTLLAYVWDRLAEAGCVVQLPQAQSWAGDPLQQLEAWLPAHLGEPLELADLAAAVNFSPRRLQQLCRERHGCSPMEWLRQQRVERLQQQLRDPLQAGKSLAALMAALQLSDSAATRNTFARRYGCTPAAYRRGVKAVQLA